MGEREGGRKEGREEGRKEGRVREGGRNRGREGLVGRGTPHVIEGVLMLGEERVQYSTVLHCTIQCAHVVDASTFPTSLEIWHVSRFHHIVDHLLY